MRRARRAAISQAEIRKRCKLYGDLMQGYRAFRNGLARDAGSRQGKYRIAWCQGWDLAHDKWLEKYNG